MLDVTKEARERICAFLRDNQAEGALRIYMAFG